MSDFIHTPYRPGETIAAIATPPGEGGVAIIRISGNNALNVAEKMFSRPVKELKSHTAYYGHILNSKREHIDTVLLLPMLHGRSYTGEDTVEIHCHGGSLITRRVLETAITAGARAALPGEFTFKAFINGKIDLAQAEAVQELIAARNAHALEAANRHLEGALSRRIQAFQYALTDTAAILEAWVDFPEEGLEFATQSELIASIQTVLTEMEQLNATFHDGRIVHEGLALCLIGAPNVGKSSLMNALLEKERAIVSHIPGTTRDVIEEDLRLNGINCRLVDTAGIREATEALEQEGIRRTHLAMEKADLILFLLDSSRSITPEEQRLLYSLPSERMIVIWNKVDLPHAELPDLRIPHVVTLSAKEKIGIEQLKETIDQVVWSKGKPGREEIILTNVRQQIALQEAMTAAQALITGLKQGLSPELLTLEMRCCLLALGKIIGSNITEDILSAIFSKFCIGK